MGYGFSRDTRYKEGGADIVSDMEAVNQWQKEEDEKKGKNSLKEKVRRLLGKKTPQ